MLRIAVTGPESTGKSSICQGLAKYYSTIWLPELARDYINKLQRPYQEEDLLKIAQLQCKKEDDLLDSDKNILFVDTDLTVMKIWSIHKYKRMDSWIANEYRTRRYDYYLLMNIDLPWVPDEQREHPHLRSYFFDWYLRELEDHGAHYSVISGKGSQRLKNAIGIVNKVFHI